MRRRQWLAWSLAPLATRLAARENKMIDHLYYHELPLDGFPELRPPNQQFGLQGRWLPAQGDPRVPVPPGSPVVLLVGFSLAAPAGPVPSWLLGVQGVQEDGQPRQLSFTLMRPPPAGDNRRMAPRRPQPALPPGQVMIYEGMFWVDLAPLLKAGALRSGDTLRLRYGEPVMQIAVPALPAAPAR